MQLEGRIREIYDVFKDYYKEHNLDIQKYDRNNFNFTIQTWFELDNFQGWFIMIHWREVTVANEKDESIVIWGLYGIVFITEDGMLWQKPVFNRSTYNIEQFSSGYVHSHIHSKTFQSPRVCREFSIPCFGFGPINSTMDALRMDYDINMWRMFVWELDKMVHVESLTGGPYFRISSVHGNIGSHLIEIGGTHYPLMNQQKTFLNEFCKKVIQAGILTFSYVNNQYVVNVDNVKTIIQLSDFFINEYNNDSEFRKRFPINFLKRGYVIREAYLYNGKLFDNIITARRNSIPLNGMTLFKFKGQDVKLEIISTSGTCNKLTILNTLVVTHLIYKIQKFINIYYGREETISEENGEIV